MGKDYRWVLFLAGILMGIVFMIGVFTEVRRPEMIMSVIPATCGFLLYSQIKSGVAIDLWYKGKYVKGSGMYYVHILGYIIAFIFTIAMPIWIVRN